MVWFRVDDGFFTHPKVASIPRAIRPAAVGAWLLAGTWSAKHLTDGVIPAHMLDELAITPDTAAALVTAKLWKRTRTGYRFHQWDDYQPTKEAVDEAREAERVRKAEYRAKRTRSEGTGRYVPQVSQWDNPGTDGGTPAGVPPLPTRPDPTPLPSEGGAHVRATPPPVDEPVKRPEAWCPRHPGGTDRPCRACGDARRRHDTWQPPAAAPGPTRPPAWDPATHCEHGQLHGRCDACEHESRHAAEVIHARFGDAA